MKDKIKLNSSKHTIYFENKGCHNISVCGALCCKSWDINLALEEYERGIYKAEAFCPHDRTPCSQQDKPCPQRAYRLKKNKDGSCLYLDNKNRCTIHSSRPIVCRNFICDSGFKIEPVCSVSQRAEDDTEICSFY